MIPIPILRKKRTPATVLGLGLDGVRLEAVLLRRSNGTLHVLKRHTATLALNPVNGSPELVGREIRNHLDQAGIRERHCVLALPMSWALSAQISIPELPEDDIPGFLEIEAERAFPYSPDALLLAVSRCQSLAGEQLATLVAIPRQQLVQLEAVLKAAQLRPTSFSLGITALQDAAIETSNGVVALAPGESAVDLQVTCQGGVAALRSLDEAMETEGVQTRLNADLLARELRVTLGQLPATLRGLLRKVRVFGGSDATQRLAQELVPRMSSLGLQVEAVRTYPPDAFRSKPPGDTIASPAFSLAARYLTGLPCRFEFLPPRVRAWQQLTARFSSRKLGWISAAAGAAAAILLIAVIYQQWQLSSLRSRWNAMAPQVTDLEGRQAQIRRYRPWFDDSFRTLAILKRVTEAFPETGIVTAKSLEIRDSSTVTCTGIARDNQSFLRMLDQLKAAKEVGNLSVVQVRGKAPLQFTLAFQWGPGGTSDN
jgi:hypothetical protein